MYIYIYIIFCILISYVAGSSMQFVSIIMKYCVNTRYCASHKCEYSDHDHRKINANLQFGYSVIPMTQTMQYWR